MGFRPRGKGRTTRREPGKMNRLELAWSQELEARRLAGEVIEWKYEPGGLRLANKTFYHPDFLVQLADGLLEYHEVKGFWEDDARVKIKVAAEQFQMFTFRAVMKKRKADPWSEEVF